LACDQRRLFSLISDFVSNWLFRIDRPSMTWVSAYSTKSSLGTMSIYWMNSFGKLCWNGRRLFEIFCRISSRPPWSQIDNS
jgi:hypothetical protein